ncbi:MAG: bifunctional phosphoribosyl-AMP cyclohydrolase/phosphoribosyl-ATP diphosphatase HisIE [Thiomonas sp.]|uniref:bifunctional phosphoribosyl-AMP cyclohydrolase/phosphoribosyl-ATP diphosphatase HisIE n=1 Tax=Thiomonas sp. TaxID=2047785 RepID=UPI002A36C8B4|nr:bifunctional phosphoribosyl-AMP cyclohydrolase/phosphoribosyl-ATP diphosphatase HisIE [Thiomonas sp.]MDY0330107.1 bifunctional phosphoribosyl-AMP cyclohydrolase/phosphoribosyl-ATP diphosphatase HisIE [Thiomonas sp.]
MNWLDQVKWDARGLVPAIAQDVHTGRVLMFAWMNREALEQTHRRGEAVYWSRSRHKLWHKGEESGHVQTVRDIRLDCDGDVVLLQVEQAGGIACHTGRESCFFNSLEHDRWTAVDPVLKDPAQIYDGASLHAQSGPAAGADTSAVLERLYATIASRKGADPSVSYVARLFHRGEDAILKKIGEEATELVMAAKDGAPEKILYETADLWFHSLIALAQHGLTPQQVLAELERREGRSGLAEFAARQADN